jgi:uncharacterized phage-like protein YoqJ
MGNREQHGRPCRWYKSEKPKQQSNQQQEVKKMQLVEQHVIDKSDSRYAVIDEAAFKSKNLYNAALYEIRQAQQSELCEHSPCAVY